MVTQIARKTRSFLALTRSLAMGVVLEARHRPSPDSAVLRSGCSVVVDLYDPSIQRYAYTLCHLLHEAGHPIVISARPSRLPFAHNRYGRLALSLPGVRLGRGRHLDAEDSLYVTDRPSGIPNRPWRAVLAVNYDWYSAPSDALVAPYPMHPAQYERKSHALDVLAGLRATPRALDVLFAGNGSTRGYSGGNVVDSFELIPRADILATLESIATPLRPPNSAVQGDRQRADLAHLMASAKGIRGAVLPDSWRIEGKDWMGALGTARFFVAPPGVAMPLSHNIIEALAVGTVPITNYGHFMKPQLQNSVNALLFNTLDELKDCIEKATTMPEAEWARMSDAAAAYYDDYLSSASFRTNLERAVNETSKSANVSLYVNAEHTTVKALLQSQRSAAVLA